MTTTKALKQLGYRSRHSAITGQGYMGGDGLYCWRIYDGAGRLAIHRISTYRSPAKAWAEAARIAVRAAV